MRVGDHVELQRWDDPYGVVAHTRTDKWSKSVSCGVRFPDGHEEWVPAAKLLRHDPSAAPPPLADDLAAMASGDPSWAALRRVAASTDDAAVEAILDRVGAWDSILRALEACRHPEVLPRAARRIDAWLDDGAIERARIAAWCLAPRRPAGWGERLARLHAAVDERYRGGMLATRLMAGGEPVEELLRLSGTPNGQVAVDALITRCPAAAAEVLVPLLRARAGAAQAGPHAALAEHVRSALAPRYQGGRAVPPPRLEPAWYELGVELQLHGAPAALAPVLPALLAAPPPGGGNVVERELQALPEAERAARVAQSPLLQVPEELVRRANLAAKLRLRDGAWWLDASALPPDVVDAVRAALPALDLGLAVHGKLSKEAQESLFGWAGLAGFRRVDLSDTLLRAAGLKRLLASPNVARVEALDLSATDLGAAGLRALVASDALPALRSLRIGAGDYDKTRWGADCLSALVKGRGASVARLERLELPGWRLTSLEPLAASELGRRLTHLSLAAHVTLGPGARQLLHALAEAGGRLEVLDLSSVFANYPDGSTDWNRDDGRQLLPLPSLRSLVLDDCHLGAEQVQALVEAWFWPQLRHLSLGGPWHELAPLETAPPGPRSLSLANRRDFDDAALEAIAGWPVIQALEVLDVRGTQVTRAPEGLRAEVRR